MIATPSVPGRGFHDRFWRRVVETTRTALARGTLEPIPTTFERVEDGGISFLLRMVNRLALKPRSDWSGSAPNPFSPWEPELFVDDISETHVALLNKFNVLEHHVLVVTREYRPQDEPLDPEDHEAVWNCLEARRGLGFYNGGREAGASQPHRHLQWVPLPFAEGGSAVPVEAVFPADLDPVQIRHSDALPFDHGILALDRSSVTANPGHALAEAADRLLRSVGRSGLIGSGPRDRPYNLLLTRRWMMAVPRRQDRFGTMSVNALGFAGGFLVRDEVERRRVLDAGPLNILASVAG